MALTLANALNLKIEVRLGLAISQFEAQLDDKQKATLRQYRSELQHHPLSAGDVIRVTSEIDRRHVGQHSTTRNCVGLRFFSFLQIIQRFASVGDIIIGGSQNLIASGVWTGVRLVLMAIVDASLHVEKLSRVFMAIGRGASRLKTLALHLDVSPRLQSYICEYNIISIQFCGLLLEYNKRSAIGKFARSLSESALRDFQRRLDEVTSKIETEVELSKLADDKTHIDLTRSIREVMTTRSKAASERQCAKLRRQILDYCSDYDHETTWKQLRKLGRASTDHDQYLQWKNSQVPETLLITGKLGSGKSVYMANMVEDLNSHLVTSKIAYYFCKHDISQSLQPLTIIGSLIRQLLQHLPDLEKFQLFLDRVLSLSVLREMLDLLQDTSLSQQTIYLIVDGLDECALQQSTEVVECLRTLQSVIGIRVSLSMRDSTGIGYHMRLQGFSLPRSLSLNDNSSALADYITCDLTVRVESGQLKVSDPSLLKEIREHLVAKSDGMYLWAALQIHTLCQLLTDFDIRQALQKLPQDLGTIFTKILSASAPQSPRYQRIILEIIIAAERPLTVIELQDALGVAPGELSYHPDRRLNDIEQPLMSCGPLLTIDEEEQTVRSLHHSFTQFLLEGANDFFSPPFDYFSASQTLGNIVATYLSYENLGGGLVKVEAKADHSFYQRLPSHVLSNVHRDRIGERVGAAYLRIRSRSPRSVTAFPVITPFRSMAVHELLYPFLAYSKACWLPSLFAAVQQGSFAPSLIQDLYKRHSLQLPTDPELVTLAEFEIVRLGILEELAPTDDSAVMKIIRHAAHPLIQQSLEQGIIEGTAFRSDILEILGMDVWDFLWDQPDPVETHLLRAASENKARVRNKMSARGRVMETILRCPLLFGYMLAHDSARRQRLSELWHLHEDFAVRNMAITLEILLGHRPPSNRYNHAESWRHSKSLSVALVLRDVGMVENIAAMNPRNLRSNAFSIARILVSKQRDDWIGRLAVVIQRQYA